MGPFFVCRSTLRHSGRWVVDDLTMDYGGFAIVYGRRWLVANIAIIVIRAVAVPIFPTDRLLGLKGSTITEWRKTAPQT